MVKILQQQGHGLALAEPLEKTEDRLEHARFTPLGGGDARSRREELQFIEAVAQPGHEPGDGVSRRADEPDQLLVGERLEEVLQGGGDWRIRDAGRRRERHAVHGCERLGQRFDATTRLGKQPAQAQTGGAGHDEGGRLAVGRFLQADCDSFQLPVATDESLAPQPPMLGASVDVAASAATLVACCNHLSRGPRAGAALRSTMSSPSAGLRVTRCRPFAGNHFVPVCPPDRDMSAGASMSAKLDG